MVDNSLLMTKHDNKISEFTLYYTIPLRKSVLRSPMTQAMLPMPERGSVDEKRTDRFCADIMRTREPSTAPERFPSVGI